MRKRIKMFSKILIICFWIILIAVCFVYREKLSVDAILNYTPENYFLAALVLLLLYAVKGVAVFIYGSILYAAGGIMLPLPLAILVNTLGTVIMTTIPYFIGKSGGMQKIERLSADHPKLQMVMDIQSKNDLFVCFFIRIVGLLPADMVAMYLGASGIKYSRYILGTVAGLFPSIILFSIMGMSIEDPSSPEFIISVAIDIALVIFSVVLFWLLKRRSKKNAE